MSIKLVSQGIIWVCETCMFAHAHGIDLRYESLHGMDYDPETNPSPEPEPWALMLNQDVSMGLTLDEHECGRLPHGEGEAFDCDCETTEFSRSACDGCGRATHGTRHAFTWWAER
jgi:hypothetical protein